MRIIKGQSTKNDVKAAYGDPSSTSFTDSGNELWNYEYAKATPKGANFIPIVGIFAGGMDVDKKQMVFFFDKAGIVQNFTVSAAKTETLRNR
jgi:outer membrane protein assembly factor BamE (lipoprotein component of BamABCDE complex)